MNATDPRTYVTQQDAPLYCVAYPCVDGWRARPLGWLDMTKAELEMEEGAEIYVRRAHYNSMIEAFSEILKEVDGDASDALRVVQEEVESLRRVIILLGAALSMSLAFIALIALGAL